MMDSDILLGNIDLDCIRKYDAALCWREESSDIAKAASPHFSYWKRSALDDFISFTMNTYRSDIGILKDFYDWLISQGREGGICDMTLLHFWKEKNIEKVGNFCANEYIKLGVSRRLLCQQEKSRYLVERGLLKIVKEDDKLFFIDKKTNEKIYAQVIHAQGDAKKYMKMLAKGKTDAVSRWISEIIRK